MEWLRSNLTVLLAVAISFTAPSYDAARPGTCEPDTIPVPCHDLSFFMVSGVLRGNTTPRLFQTIDARDMEGQLITFTPTPPDHPDDIWSIFIQAVDLSGNISCWSNIASINGTVSVNDPPREGRDEWFDVQGRKLRRKPTMPGAYYHRRGTWKRIELIYH